MTQSITDQAANMLGARKQKIAEPSPILASNGKSSLVAAIEEKNKRRNLDAVEYDVAGFFGFGGEAVHKVKVRVATKAEQDQALLEAYAAIENAAKKAESLRSDVDYCNGKKAVMLLGEAIRDARDPNSLSAFPSPEWIEENLTPDQIAILLNLYNREVAKAAPAAIKFDADQVETLMSVCGTAYETDLPERALLHFSRDQMVELFIQASIVARVRSEECEALKARIAELESEKVAPVAPEPQFVFVPDGESDAG